MGSSIARRPVPHGGCVPTVGLNDVFALIAHEKHICRHIRNMKSNIGCLHAIVLEQCALRGTFDSEP